MLALKEVSAVEIKKKESVSYLDLSNKFNKLDMVMKIALHYLYSEDKPQMFVLFWKKFRATDYKKETLRRKVHKYKELGLYELINTNGLMIIPRYDLKEDIFMNPRETIKDDCYSWIK